MCEYEYEDESLRLLFLLSSLFGLFLISRHVAVHPVLNVKARALVASIGKLVVNGAVVIFRILAALNEGVD